MDLRIPTRRAVVIRTRRAVVTRTRRAVVRRGIRRRHSAVRNWRPAVVAAVTAALIAPVRTVRAEAVLRRGARPVALAPACGSPRDPLLAARLSKDIRAALSFRPSAAAAVAAHDDAEDLWCSVHAGCGYDSASVARVLIMETVLWRAEQLRRRFGWFEPRRAAPMLPVTD